MEPFKDTDCGYEIEIKPIPRYELKVVSPDNKTIWKSKYESLTEAKQAARDIIKNETRD